MSSSQHVQALVDDRAERVAQRLQDAAVPLRSGETPDWSREARLLVARADPDDPNRDLEHLVRNRLDGVPLGYLVGNELFLGQEFAVEPGLVVPHPATEILALLAVRALDRHPDPAREPALLEVGVGVGVVAVSAVQRRPAVQAHCSELSGAALRLSRENAERHLRTSSSHIHLYQAYVTDDLFSPFLVSPLQGVDVVVSNPPYLVEGDEVSEATKKSGVAHYSFSPDDDPSWFLQRVLDAPEGLLGENCSVLMECSDFYLPDHEAVMIDGGWSVETFDRESYVEQFGADPAMRPMTPTPHRVLHAWRGSGGPLEA